MQFLFTYQSRPNLYFFFFGKKALWPMKILHRVSYTSLRVLLSYENSGGRLFSQRCTAAINVPLFCFGKITLLCPSFILKIGYQTFGVTEVNSIFQVLQVVYYYIVRPRTCYYCCVHGSERNVRLDVRTIRLQTIFYRSKCVLPKIAVRNYV